MLYDTKIFVFYLLISVFVEKTLAHVKKICTLPPLPPGKNSNAVPAKIGITFIISQINFFVISCDNHD